MISRLSGTLVSKQPPLLVIDVNGVGYEVEAPLSVFYDLPETGKPLVLLTHLSISDTAHTLYGFASEAERILFRRLLKISGIGAKLALTILSGASGQELAQFVADGDTAALTRLPGIGKKTAERIIIELRDKLDDLPTPGGSLPGGGAPTPGGPVTEARNALVALGYKPQEATRMARAVAESDMGTEDIIRLALQGTITKP